MNDRTPQRDDSLQGASRAVRRGYPDGPVRKLLVVEDEREAGEDLALYLRQEAGYVVDVAGSAEEALSRFARETYHLVITDLLLPGNSGVDLTRTLHEYVPSCVVILITGHATVKTAVAALKRGAADYIRKPIVPRKLRERIAALLENRPDYLPNRLLAGSRQSEILFEGMIARSRGMHTIFDRIRLAAQSDATVLITGESGTGKELVARAIHNRSQRHAGPFVPVHTGAIPRDLIASELFGHERGSFTGAVERKEGKFELAEGGTIFLDEISTMDERTQINLLRILETFAYMRIGGKKERRADVRVVAASNRDLLQLVAQGTFREDLYYRLNILQLGLPPLRDRREDIPLLTGEFVAHYCSHYHKTQMLLPPDTLRLLETYPWPGNVRELRNVIEQAVLLARTEVFSADLLPQMIYRAGPAEQYIRIPLGWSLKDAEREVILRTLEGFDGNKRTVAEVLGISRRCLYNKLVGFTTGEALPSSVVALLDDESGGQSDG